MTKSEKVQEYAPCANDHGDLMRNFRKIQVHMDWDPEMVYIIPTERRDGKRYIEKPLKGGKWKVEETPYGFHVDLSEVLKFTREDAESLLIGLMKVLGSPGEDQLQGKLEATENHLDDMRKISYKLLKIEG